MTVRTHKKIYIRLWHICVYKQPTKDAYVWNLQVEQQNNNDEIGQAGKDNIMQR